VLEKEKKIRWDYNVPVSVEFDFIYDSTCPICRKTDICNWVAPYLISSIPYDELIGLFKEKGMVVTEEIIKEHMEHFKVNYVTDEEIEEMVIKDLKTIDSDIQQQMKEKPIIDSLIRGLYAQKLKMEKRKDCGKDYILICKQLKDNIELKLKMKHELQEDSTTNIVFSDMIKMGDGSEPAKDVNPSQE